MKKFRRAVNQKLVLLGAAALFSLSGVRAEPRFPCRVDDSYSGPRQEAFQKLRFAIPGLAQADQVEVSSKMGLDYRDGFRYPLTIGFTDSPLPMGEYALAYVHLYQYGTEIRQEMNINLEAYAQSSFDFEKVFAHEMSHAILADALGKEAFGKLPTWLIEGLALWVAGQGEELARAEAHRYPAFAERVLVRDLTQPASAAMYPQYFLAVEYIEKTKGAAAIQNLVHDLAGGKTFPEALAYNVEGWEDFQKNVRDFSTRYIQSLGPGEYGKKERPY